MSEPRATSQTRKKTAPAVPEGSRVYAVGDIHGRADLLAALHRMIEADAAAADLRKVLVYLGDYVDRGPESKETIDLLLRGPLPGFEAVHLKGNHEDFLLRFLADPSLGPLWMVNGGDATLASYGVEGPAPWLPEREWLRAAQAELGRKLPRSHLEFLRALRLSHVEGDYLFVHAGIRPGVPLAEQDEHDLMWIREEFLYSAADHGRTIVHGHTISAEPVVLANRIGIDTGAFATGRLTSLVLEGEGRRILHT